MRGAAGLGACNCVDYFLANQEFVFLIEETQLSRTIDNLKSQFCCLEDNDQNSHMNNLILWENQSKVYGSMLVLCRLAASCENMKALIQQKSYKFWLVASGQILPGDMRFIDNLSSRPKSSLKSQLSKATMNDVAIVPTNNLAKKIFEIDPIYSMPLDED